MATIKVKLRPSSCPGKPGTVFYQIHHRRTVRQISTRFQLLPEQWSLTRSMPLPESEKMALIRRRIESGLQQLQRIVRQFESRGLPYTADEIVASFRNIDHRSFVLHFLREQIEHLRRVNRLGTAHNYERARKSFASFLQDEDLPFSAIDEELIDSYNLFLVRRGVVRNSISFYMRILRAVYNKAVRQQLVEQRFPFREVYTGVDKTRKRAVDEQIITRLYKLELPPQSALTLARDLFIFSYCARGMAFIDMAYLRKSDISDGMISYTRRKTGQRLYIRIEPCIRRIIDRYAAHDRSYIFPILQDEAPEQCYVRYERGLNYYNKCLKKLSGELQLPVRLSSYVARHSWATAARQHQVPISVISAGMGHTSERTTQIYLMALEHSVIDAANQTILARLG